MPCMYLIDSPGGRRCNLDRSRKRLRGAMFRAYREAREDITTRTTRIKGEHPS